MTDTYYRKDGIKIAVIPWVKEINEKLVGGIKILAAHADGTLSHQENMKLLKSYLICLNPLN